MNLPDGLLAGAWTTVAWLVFIPLFLRVVWRAPWRRLADPSRFNAWLGTIVVLVLLWSLNAGIKPGLSLHLIGAAVLALTFGPGLAFLGLCAALFGVTLNGEAGWASFAANALVMGGVSVGISRGVLRFSERFLPRQLFVYLFANGFFGAGLSIIAVGFVASGLLAFSEAWLSGMVITLFVVYRPQWVATFEDSRYLFGK